MNKYKQPACSDNGRSLNAQGQSLYNKYKLKCDGTTVSAGLNCFELSRSGRDIKTLIKSQSLPNRRIIKETCQSCLDGRERFQETCILPEARDEGHQDAINKLHKFLTEFTEMENSLNKAKIQREKQQAAKKSHREAEERHKDIIKKLFPNLNHDLSLKVSNPKISPNIKNVWATFHPTLTKAAAGTYKKPKLDEIESLNCETGKYTQGKHIPEETVGEKSDWEAKCQQPKPNEGTGFFIDPIHLINMMYYYNEITKVSYDKLIDDVLEGRITYHSKNIRFFGIPIT